MSGEGGESDADQIRAKVEASSLGTPEAQALRATVSDEHAARIVKRAEELARCICMTPGSSIQCVACYPDLARRFNEAAESRAAYRRDAADQQAEHNAAMRAEANYGRDVFPGDDDRPTRKELEAEEREWRGGRDW